MTEIEYDPAKDAPRFAGRSPPPGKADVGIPVSEPRTWLLTQGIARTALVRLDESPSALRS